MKDRNTPACPLGLWIVGRNSADERAQEKVKGLDEGLEHNPRMKPGAMISVLVQDDRQCLRIRLKCIDLWQTGPILVIVKGVGRVWKKGWKSWKRFERLNWQ